MNWQALLNRWISGRITAREEQELDRFAQDDPFLADALDGFRNQPDGDHSGQIGTLKARFQKEQKRRGIPIWRIAAAIAVLIFAGVTMWQINTPKGMDLAQMESVKEESPPSLVEFDAGPPPASYDDVAVSEKPAAKIARPKEQQAYKTTPPPSPVPKPQSAETSPSVKETVSPSAARGISPTIKKSTNPTQPEVEIADKPVAAEISLQVTEKGLSLPEEEADIVTPTAKNETASLPVAEPDSFPLKDIPDSRVERMLVLKERKAKRSLDVQNARAFRIPASTEMKILNSSLARPSIDSIAYRQYIKDNLHYPETAKAAGISGTVILQFSFDQEGKPYNILPLKSLGFGCDEEAIRLLREGPVWIAPDYSVATYTIRFD